MPNLLLGLLVELLTQWKHWWDGQKKMQFGEMGCGRVALLRCVQLISHLSVLGYIFTSLSGRKNIRCHCFLSPFLCPYLCLLLASICCNNSECSRAVAACEVWALRVVCVCLRNGVGLCVIVRWNGLHVYRAAEQGRVAAACRDDGIGKRSLSLGPTAKSAGDMAAISPLSLSV